MVSHLLNCLPLFLPFTRLRCLDSWETPLNRLPLLSVQQRHTLTYDHVYMFGAANLESMWPVCVLLEESRAAGGNSQREITNSKKKGQIIQLYIGCVCTCVTTGLFCTANATAAAVRILSPVFPVFSWFFSPSRQKEAQTLDVLNSRLHRHLSEMVIYICKSIKAVFHSGFFYAHFDFLQNRQEDGKALIYMQEHSLTVKLDEKNQTKAWLILAAIRYWSHPGNNLWVWKIL